MVDIPPEPERTMLFGDGCFAVLVDCYLDEKTNETVFMFRPTPRMKQKNRIQPYDYDEVTGYIIGRYPSDLCVCLDLSPDFQTWVLFCDYRGNPLDFTKKINQNLLNKLNIYRNELEVLRILIQVRFNRLKRYMRYPEEAKLELIKEMIKQKRATSTALEDMGSTGESTKGGGSIE